MSYNQWWKQSGGEIFKSRRSFAAKQKRTKAVKRSIYSPQCSVKHYRNKTAPNSKENELRAYFCSCDLHPDQTTLIYEPKLHFCKMYMHIVNELSKSGILRKIHTTARRVVKMRHSIQCINWNIRRINQHTISQIDAVTLCWHFAQLTWIKSVHRKLPGTIIK